MSPFPSHQQCINLSHNRLPRLQSIVVLVGLNARLVVMRNVFPGCFGLFELGVCGSAHPPVVFLHTYSSCHLITLLPSSADLSPPPPSAPLEITHRLWRGLWPSAWVARMILRKPCLTSGCRLAAQRRSSAGGRWFHPSYLCFCVSPVSVAKMFCHLAPAFRGFTCSQSQRPPHYRKEQRVCLWWMRFAALHCGPHIFMRCVSGSTW